MIDHPPYLSHWSENGYNIFVSEIRTNNKIKMVFDNLHVPNNSSKK